MRSFDCFVRFLPVSDRRELNSYVQLLFLSGKYCIKEQDLVFEAIREVATPARFKRSVRSRQADKSIRK